MRILACSTDRETNIYVAVSMHSLPKMRWMPDPGSESVKTTDSGRLDPAQTCGEPPALFSGRAQADMQVDHPRLFRWRDFAAKTFYQPLHALVARHRLAHQRFRAAAAEVVDQLFKQDVAQALGFQGRAHGDGEIGVDIVRVSHGAHHAQGFRLAVRARVRGDEGHGAVVID